MGIYVIGIGGTGSKCIEAVVQLGATGLFYTNRTEVNPSINVLFVDADETNGNLQRAQSSLEIYRNCYNQIASRSEETGLWMTTKVDSVGRDGVWSPFDEQLLKKDLKTFFNYNTIKQNQADLAGLFDVLYTKEEREVTLDVGFRGRPAIGAAVMSQVNLDKLDQEPWGSLIKKVQEDAAGGKRPKIFLCGSIFGGTGASGLPTLARLIHNKLENLSIRTRVDLGSLFVLPYFGFSAPPGEDPDGIYARSDQFLLNTEAALRYYVTQAQEVFDRVYLLGNPNLTSVKFSIGKNSQLNQAHFIELYAALAVRDFSLQSSDGERGSVVLISRQNMGSVLWGDLPEESVVKQQLVQAAKFAYLWLAEIVPELEEAKKRSQDRFPRLLPWLDPFFRSRQNTLPEIGDAGQQKIIEVINKWCRDYLRWLYQVHECKEDEIRLFRADALAQYEGKLKPEDLFSMVVDEDAKRTRRSDSLFKKLKEQIQAEAETVPDTRRGVIALAKTTYRCCAKL